MIKKKAAGGNGAHERRSSRKFSCACIFHEHTVIGSALQEESTLLQDPEISNADEVVVDPGNLAVSREPCRAWKNKKNKNT